MRNAFIATLTEIAARDDKIFIVSGDAGFGVFENYRATFPGRFMNAGIAEANMIGYAAGLSLSGFNVFVYNIIPFILYRCYEQVRNDICYQRLPVTLIGIGSGLTYAPSGMTHYGIEDLAVCLTLPNLIVISPIDPQETRAAVAYAAGAEVPVYIRVAKTGEPVFRTGNNIDILQPAVIRAGEGVAILAHGTVFEEAIKAADQLAPLRIHPRLISVPTLQPFPGQEIARLIADCRAVITLEEHCRAGGLAGRLADFRADTNLPLPRQVSLALPNRFLHDINKLAGMRAKYGINAAAVVQAVRAIFD